MKTPQHILDRNNKWRKDNKEKKALSDKKWKEENKEHLQNYFKKRRIEKMKDPQFAEKERGRNREYARNHKKEQLENQRKRLQDPIARKHRWEVEKLRRAKPEVRVKHLLQKKVYQHNRKIGTKTLKVNTVQQVYEENIKRYGTLTCELCFKPVEFGDDHLEHFHPVSRRGEYDGDINERKNLGVAHSFCNVSKNNKTLQEYLSITKI